VYYAMVGPAADIWSSFQPSGTLEQAVSSLAARYGAPIETIRTDVEPFVTRLEETGLLTTVEQDPTPADLPARGPGDAAWAEPELEEYLDMADLVLLDPIHQVDESGWPHLPQPPE